MAIGVGGWGLSARSRSWIAVVVGSVAAVATAAGVLFAAAGNGARAQSGPSYQNASYETSQLPGFRLSVQPDLVAPSDGVIATVYGSPSSPTAAASSARITTLARSLENDTDRIYQFVHNTIRYEPQFGLHKGADGVLLDGAGGAFDQAQLMIELLRASGKQARFVLGTVTLNEAQAKSILRVDTARQACQLLAAAGTPATVNGSTTCGSLSGAPTAVVMLHAWVETEIGGTWYAFDPSLKTNIKIEGIDLWDAAGTSASSGWNNVSSGVSISGGDLNGVNAAGIGTKLATYADNLQDEIAADHSDKSLKQLTGGWEIVRTEAAPRVAQTPYQSSVSTRWAGDVPAPYRATLRLQTAGFDHTFDLPSIYGWRTQAQLQGGKLVVAVRKREHLVGEATAYFSENGPNDPACDSVNVVCGSATTQTDFDAWNRQLNMTIDHPYVGRRTGINPTTSSAWSNGTFGDEMVVKHLEIGKRADILVRTAGGVGTRRATWSSATDPIQQHRLVPAGDPADCYTRPPGFQYTDEACDGTQGSDFRYWTQQNWWQYPLAAPRLFPVGEIAGAEMGMKRDGVLNGWTDLFDRTVTILEPISGARIFHQHSIGLSITPSYGFNVLDIDTSVGIAAGGSDQPHHILAALASLSVAEEALALGQVATERPSPGSMTQATAASRFASASTLKVLTAPNTANSLPSDVSADTKAQIEAYLAKGYSVVATTTPNGNAFLARRNDGSEQAWILRSYDAGATPNVDPRVYFLKGAQNEKPNPIDYLGKAEARQISANVASSLLGAVDLRNGTLSFGEGTEVSVGQGDFPYSLSFSRSYSSTGPVEGGGALGMGWTHNWESSVSQTSDVGVLFPEAEAVSSAPMLVAVLVALEAGRADTLEASAISGVATNWLQSQAEANVIAVNGGGRSARFVRMADGSWRNPASPTESIAVGQSSPGIWTYDWTLADKSVMAFRQVTNTYTNMLGATLTSARATSLTSWAFPTGVVITLTYTGGNDANSPLLSSVSNNLGATLAFEHLTAPTQNLTSACYSMAGQLAYGGGRREAEQQCYEESQQSGRLLRVSAGADKVEFGYWAQCPRNSNFCAFMLNSAKRPLLRDREYIYGTPTGALASAETPMEYQQVLTEVRDIGVATPRARFDWRAVGGQVAPYVAEAFDALDRKTTYYSSTFTFSSAKDAENAVVRQAYDEDGRLIASADGEGRTSRAAYDGPGRTNWIQTPFGNTTMFKFDARGNLTESRQEPISNCANGLTAEQIAWWCQTIVVKAEYDAHWNKPAKIILPATEADPNEREWTLTYNAQGLLETQTGPTVTDGVTGNPGQAVWRTWYDSYGRVNRTQDPVGIETANTYGGAGLPAFCLSRTEQGSQNSGGIVTDFVCDAVGNVTSTTVGPVEGTRATTTATYDSLRRKVGEVGPAGTGIETVWIFDLNGDQIQVQQRESASVWRTTHTIYSATHKPLTVEDPSGDVTRTCYDLVDRPVTVIDAELRAMRTAYNKAGQPTEIHRFQRAAAASCTVATELPQGHGSTETRWRRFQYNAGGLQSAEIDARGNVTQQVYDGLGRPARTVYANTLQAWTAMDQRGRVIARKQPGGHRASVFYDAMGRDFHVREYGASETGYQWRGRNTRAAYDLAGRPVWRDVSTQTTTSGTFDDALRRDIRNYAYDDPLGRLTAEQWRPEGAGGISYTTGYAYTDGRGNRTQIQMPQSGGGTWNVTYVYDLANRVSSVSFPGSGGAQTAAISHDPLSRRTAVDRPGVAADTAYAYDVDNELTSLSHAFVPGAGPGSLTLTYGRDGSGKVTSIGFNQPAFEWTPDLGYARTYGAASNMNRLPSETDAITSNDLTWNGDGDLVQELRTPVSGGSPVTWTYHWTYGHRLAIVTNNAPTGALTASYHYDGDDRRTKKVVNGVMTRTMWSGTDELAEYDAYGDMIRRFIPDGTGVMDARLATVTSAGAVYWHHTDHLGSVIATSDTSGQTVGVASYSPYGEFGTGQSAPPQHSPFGFTGRQYDPETGLYQYRARYYSPRLGQFLSADPIGTKDDPNLYLYVGLDPVNMIDPTGMEGLNYFSYNNQSEANFRYYGGRAVQASGAYFVAGHGNPSWIQNQTGDVGGPIKKVTADALASKINWDPTAAGLPIILLSCDTAGEYAATLSSSTQQDVWAPMGVVEYPAAIDDGAFDLTVGTELGTGVRDADSQWQLYRNGVAVEGATITRIRINDGDVQLTFGSGSAASGNQPQGNKHK